MTSFTVVPTDVLRDVRARVAHALVGSKIDTFDEDVIAPGATSVHGQLNAIANHRVDEFLCSELAALIDVDDVGSAEAGIRLLQRRDRVHGLQRDQIIYFSLIKDI